MRSRKYQTKTRLAFQALRNKAATDGEQEQAMNYLLDRELIVECGCCGGYHPVRQQDFEPDPRFNGGQYECRSDINRF